MSKFPKYYCFYKGWSEHEYKELYNETDVAKAEKEIKQLNEGFVTDSFYTASRWAND